MKLAFLFPFLILLQACDSLPRDPDGTLERVRSERTFRVGLIAEPGARLPATRDFLSRVSAATGATPRIEIGAAEPLLTRLEDGALDLVVGPMRSDSPWALQVSFLPPLVEAPDQRHQLLAMTRNGENGWNSLLYGEAKAVSGQ